MMGMNKMNKETRDVRTTGVSLRVWIVLIVLCLVNVAAHLIVMPSLPAQIPTHWGADGAVDGWVRAGWPLRSVLCRWRFW